LVHVGKLLKALGYSRQIPQQKDPRQDKGQVRQWKEKRLKALKTEAFEQGRAFCYADEASFFLNPTFRAGYAPKGQPPVAHTWDKSFKHVFACSAISCQGDFVYTFSDQPYTGEKIVEFLKELLAHFSQPITLVWDGASIHFCKAVKAFLTELPDGRLKLVRLPAYSPELNADEQVWNYIKNVKLRNRVFKKVSHLEKSLHKVFDEFSQNKTMIRRFFHHPKVAFY